MEGELVLAVVPLGFLMKIEQKKTSSRQNYYPGAQKSVQ